MNELKELKPAVQQKINELNALQSYQNNSLEWPTMKNSTLTNHNMTKAIGPTSHVHGYYSSRTQQFSHSRPVKEQFQRMMLNFPCPKEQNLSKHSILGPNGLHGQWEPPKSDIRVQYPSNIDLTLVDILSLQKSLENGLSMKNDYCNSKLEVSSAELVVNLNDNSESGKKCHVEELHPMISFEESETPVQINITRQPSPHPVLFEVQDLVLVMSAEVTKAECRIENLSANNFANSKSPLELHIVRFYHSLVFIIF
ncbi:hypothetical protein SLEP1_g33277 [Rubroshorea leprosula]|uniref:Uncharacterized protein n=1 Tax=Rubroshorea leprosula TaxID=152421 RepID=A0AAV5KG33_9ROSI|nr:hypothetical protein SLEP1_g33277 [Rubroshorea leprosula]